MAKSTSRILSSKARRLQIAAARAAQAAAEQAALAEQAAAKAKAAEQAEKAAEKTEKAAKTALDDAKKLLDGSALTNRNLLIAFYVLLATGLMLCLGISDEQLLLNKAPVPLPLLNLTLPIWAFASVVPLLLLVVHFDLLHNLNEHSHKLQAWLRAWDAVPRPLAQGGTQMAAGALSDQLFPFVYDFAWLHGCGRGQSNINSKLLPGLSWALYCWAPFTVLIVFFIRFADLQNYWFTGWHVLLILLDAGWLYWYWPRFPNNPPSSRWLPLWLRKRLKLPTLLMPVSILAGCWTLWLFVEVQRVLDFDGSPSWVEAFIGLEERLGTTLVPRITVPGFEAQLAPNHFAMAKVLNPGKKEDELWPETGPSINLVGRRLGFADLGRAVLPRAILTAAKLKYARLSHARMPNAILGNAQLQGADLIGAKLWGADLRDAKLQGASLMNAKLQGADLRGATILGSIIVTTELFGAALPKNTQLIATSGTPRWNKPDRSLYEIKLVNVVNWKRLVEAEQRINTAKPQPLPLQDPLQFAQAWLNTVCQQAEIAKNMLTFSVFRPLPTEITDTALSDWIETHAECLPYHALAKQVIKDRAEWFAPQQKW